jgi:uncharacterized protein with NAD-binding domain and iron-sulfur cluster
VYERSSRLGGKGGSVRAADGRILEHGLHIWLGFYDNAFRMIRDCYAIVESNGWGPDNPDPAKRLAHSRFDDAFFPEPQIGVSGKNSDGDVVWSGFLPPEPGLPGDPIEVKNNPFTLASYLLRCVHLLKTLTLSVIGGPADGKPGRARPESRSALDEALDLDFSIDPTQSPELFIQKIATNIRAGTLTLAAAVLQAVTIFENILQDFNHSPQVAGSVLNLMKALAGQARKQLRDLVAIDEQLRWKTEIIDIVMTIVVGLYRDRVLLSEKGLDAINSFDYREWLLRHGATKSSLQSRFITGIYDLVFAYEGGDRTKPRLAAGVALRGALRMFFTYRGSMFWRMRSGMGDAVFAPLFKVMSQSGSDPKSGRTLSPVKFHFRHELSGVTYDFTDKNRRFVTKLAFTATVDDEPQNVLDDFGCWSEREPAAGARQKPVPLRVGEDFDAVIFAMGLDNFAEFVNGAKTTGVQTVPAAWARAVTTRNQTVATKAAQLWLEQDLEGLGWFRGPAVVAGLDGSYQTWADMTHTLPSERAWRSAQPRRVVTPADRARSIAYFCGVLPDDDRPAGTPSVLQQDVELRLFLMTMAKLWPKTAGNAKRLKLLRFHTQTNVDGSDRYSLSLPGTLRNRLSPLDTSVQNMSVAGDWTACGLDAGCVEAAVMSGMLAAHAITGKEPSLESIIGFDHP